jgi:hypothetical protein
MRSTKSLLMWSMVLLTLGGVGGNVLTRPLMF